MISAGEGSYVELNFTSVEETIGEILDDLRAMRQEENFPKTLGSSAVEGMRKGESDPHKRLSGPFLLVVAGDFKRGKSTLINALLREFDERVAQALARADAIVYVVSAKAPLSLTEQQFLSACVVPNSFSRLLVALNLSDCLETPENITKVKNLVSERVRLFIPTVRSSP